MNDCVIEPGQSRSDHTVPPVGILAVNPTDAACLPAIAKKFQLSRSFLFHSSLYIGTDFFVAGPAVGAPMAVMTAEKLIALGAKRLILYGWCGALSPLLAAGTVCIPRGAYSEEGTSTHYIPRASFLPSPELHEELHHWFQTISQSVRTSVIWTTDAPYRETRGKVSRYAQQGIEAVDMECSALYGLAAYRTVDCAAVLYVSDELYHDRWKPKFTHKQFRKASSQLLEQLCSLLSFQNGN